MRSVHLAQISFIKPIIDKLYKNGTPVDKLIKQTSLKYLRTDNPELFIPATCQYEFFSEVMRYTGEADIAQQFAKQYKLKYLGEWGRQLSECRNTLSACLGAEKFDSYIQTNQRIRLQIKGPKAKLHNIYTDVSPQYGGILEAFSLLVMLDGFRFFTSKDWTPLEIHLRYTTTRDIERYIPTSNCTVKENQSSFGLVFSTELLSQISTTTKDDIHLSNLHHPGISYTDRLVSIFQTIRNPLFINLLRISELLDFSPRTIQRRLAEEGTTFFEVIDQFRFQKALTLLANTEFKIAEISDRLGYANPSNFERAFRRWTATSAMRYRNMHSNGAK